MPVATTTKVNGLATRETDKELCSGFRVTRSTRVTGKITSKVASALIFGLTALPIPSCLEIDMLVTGDWVKDTEKVPFTTPTEANMKENGKRITSTAMVSSHSKMVLNTEDHLKMIECLKDKSHRKRLTKLLFNSKMS